LLPPETDSRDEPVAREDGLDTITLTLHHPPVSHTRTEIRTQTCREEVMKVTTWAVFGSLVVNLALGLAVASVFSVAPVRAAETGHCTATHAARSEQHPVLIHRAYVVAARMGWAAG
jgi:hypothetical protein